MADLEKETNGTNGTNGAHTTDAPVKLTRQDFVSDQEVRWCPGCGDYSILAQVQRVMPELNIPKEKIVFVSGIGCSSRFPYYMDTYGFHGIHGRAPALATGIKAANPELSVWVITGDGDALSIGGNHFIHAIRRNLDLKIILFNNRIYGLTKGQYSPTSELGKKNKSAPMGVIDYPINPLSMAFASEATFVARSIDTDPKHLTMIIERLARHKGSAFVEVFQNCNIFNDGVFKPFSERVVRDERMLYLEHGKPLLFGKNKDKGIRLNGLHPEVVQIGESGVGTDDILVHNESDPEPNLSYVLGRMQYPDYPVPVGVFRAVEKPTYEDMLEDQIKRAVAERGPGNLSKLINSGETWVINAEGETV
ncbi:MAG: 2-oxoacid:ferredoxin oxidoreductase subunit beta [Acidobacteria bacterium]|nr:2-oxoacid:ferredoxin oxidoreductase subunit beta [Acidobacteriota bacterium]MCW5967446.1 2-oxoacid:ferredoxin oxidoreductase subunit beta [Blastocatellales bacterium]